MPWQPKDAYGSPELWEIYSDFPANAVAVSTRTSLLNFSELGQLYKDVKFELQNTGSARVVLYVTKSADGVVADEDEDTIGIGAGKQRSLKYLDNSDLFMGVDAAGDPDAGNPASTVKLRVLVRKRRR